MATKNGVCPYCQFSRLERRVFPVNPEASTVFCPFCMRELDPTRSINLYNEILEKLTDKADNTLFVACDPVLAYAQYADVLEIEPDNPKALLGRILCLIYTSRIRRSYLAETSELLDIVVYKGSEGVVQHVEFLKRINFALDEYDLALYKALTYREQFYDLECLNTYVARLSEIIQFKKDILETLKQIKKENMSTQKNEVLINLVSHSISEKESNLRTSKYLITGVGYKITKYNGEYRINESGENTEPHYNKRHLYTLDPNDKTKKLIDDKVFVDYTPIIRLKNMAIYLAVFFLLGAFAAGALSYVYFENKILFPIMIIVGGACIVAFIVLLVLYLIWKSILKKRKMRID